MGGDGEGHLDNIYTEHSLLAEKSSKLNETEGVVLINFNSVALQDIFKLAADGRKCDHEDCIDASCNKIAVMICMDNILTQRKNAVYLLRISFEMELIIYYTNNIDGVGAKSKLV